MLGLGLGVEAGGVVDDVGAASGVGDASAMCVSLRSIQLRPHLDAGTAKEGA